MNKQSRLRLLTLVGLMLALASNRLVNALADDSIVWQAHDATISASASFAVLLAFLYAPYSELRTKCVLASASAICLVDVACILSGSGGYYWYWIALQFIAGLSASSFYMLRAHDQTIDSLDNSHLYCVRAIPNSFQDLIISMLGFYGQDGGYSLYADGHIYRFKRGILVRQSIAKLPPNRYHVTRGKKLAKNVVIELDGLVGRRWTWRQNCLTVFGPIWRRERGRPD